MLIVVNDPWRMCFRQPEPQVQSRQIQGHTLTNDWTLFPEADAVIFHIPSLNNILPKKPKPKQIWVGWSMESEVFYPLRTSSSLRSKFALIMNYHRNADIPVTYFAHYRKRLLKALDSGNENVHKPNLCSCFISNINKDAGNRMPYIQELSQHLNIHFYGKFLKNKALENDLGEISKHETIARYKFDLAFENSIAEDYVTEKLFGPLIMGTIPVYCGAPNVEDFLPGDHCIINVRDYASPDELAKYLLYLNGNEKEYQRYHAWRQKPLRPQFLEMLEEERISVWERLVAKLSQIR